ncbi:Pes4p [Saccharomyces cerevisiae x Saccharomyces kudriavzevii VIN7]|uniref:Pes4p n=1 Tax=Saccharomyces cerevisiae x Saccharomyces kudriavzevii (strain VIN7) TaxID=1095631 RepID=H0GUC5_SACCK|nr:Pes4p [Saccharomyces cerevisiae x Saccharomyces kudriavzevii VIN7]
MVPLNILKNQDLTVKKEQEKKISFNPVVTPIRPDDYHEKTSRSSSSSHSDSPEFLRINNNKSSQKNGKLKVFESKKLIPLFIGDLHETVTEETLKGIFGKFPSFVSAKVCLDSITKKSLGHGYLNFEDKEEAERAMEELNYTDVNGREIRIMPSLRNTTFRKNFGTNVFFSNLPLNNPLLTTRVFYDTFSRYGKILSCKLDSRKDIGFVYFENEKTARNVIKMYNNTSFFGKKILCGIHFDKEVRSVPNFETQKSRLDAETIIEKEQALNATQLKRNDGASKNNQSSSQNSIFIKNLPIITTRDDVLNFFSEVGPIKSIYLSNATKVKYLWAFVTYKSNEDSEKAIKRYNNFYFRGKKLLVSRAQDKEERAKFIESQKMSTLFLENLSAVCNKEFLKYLCHQENIRPFKIQIDGYNESSATYSGHIKFRNFEDATRIFNFLNNRLVGGSIIMTSWERQSGTSKNYEDYGTRSIHTLSHPQITPYYRCSHTNDPNSSSMRISSSMNSSTRSLIKNRSFNKKVLETFEKQVRRGIDFMRFPSATRDENVHGIAEYIFDTYWNRDVLVLDKFLSLLNSSPYHEGVLQKQIEEAANSLGFKR